MFSFLDLILVTKDVNGKINMEKLEINPNAPTIREDVNGKH